MVSVPNTAVYRSVSTSVLLTKTAVFFGGPAQSTVVFIRREKPNTIRGKSATTNGVQLIHKPKGKTQQMPCMHHIICHDFFKN